MDVLQIIEKLCLTSFQELEYNLNTARYCLDIIEPERFFVESHGEDFELEDYLLKKLVHVEELSDSEMQHMLFLTTGLMLMSDLEREASVLLEESPEESSEEESPEEEYLEVESSEPILIPTEPKESPKLVNITSPNSQRFFFSTNSTPIATVHNGDVYQTKDPSFNRHIYYGK